MLQIGDKCITTKIFENCVHRFETGIEVTIIDIDTYRGYGFVDSEGNRCIECGWAGFEKINKI